MYNLGVFSVILMSGILKLACGTDYCDPKLCTSNGVVLPHIGCEHSGKFASNCVQPAMIPVSPYLKQVILHEHNDLRNKLANGSLPGFQTAKRMLTLTWDSELEFLAGLNVMQCEMEHDQCHNTIAYKYSGQNIGVQHQTDPLYPPEYESLIIYLINAWFNEYRFASQRDTDKCLRIDRENEIGHFTELLQERTSKVGCGISRYVKFLQGENWDTILLACNYNYGNMVGLPTYIPGGMASACKTGPNHEFNGLCSPNEIVPPIPESEEEVPLHPVFTNKNRLMKAVTSNEPVCAAPSRQASRPSQIKSGRLNIEQLLQRAIIQPKNRPQQTGLRRRPSIIVFPLDEDRIAARTCNLRPVPAPRGISPVPSHRDIRPITLPRSINVPPPVPFPRGKQIQHIPDLRPPQPFQPPSTKKQSDPLMESVKACPIKLARKHLPVKQCPAINRQVRPVPSNFPVRPLPPLPLQPPPTMKQSAPLMEAVKACPIKLAQKQLPVKQRLAIDRQVRPVPSNFPVRAVPPANHDDESEEDLPPPLPLQPPPTMKQSASLMEPVKPCPIKLAQKQLPVKERLAIDRQVRPVPSNFPVRTVPPAKLDDESEEDLPPPLPLQPPPTMKQSASLTGPNKVCPIRPSKSWS